MVAAAAGAHARSSRERRLSLVEREPFGKDGVVAALQSRDQAGPQRVEGNTALARQVRQVTGAAQQALHAARPVFLLDVDEGLKFAQVMSVTQGVQHARHGVVGLPVVMHDRADDVRQ